MSKQDCLQGNWLEAGYKDGSAGRTTSRFPSHVKACAKHGAVANRPTYLTGYEKGVQDYCLPHNGIDEGTRNHDYRGICPVELETGFLEHYIAGLQIARRHLKMEYWHYDHKLDDARYLRMRLTTDQSKDKINRRINNLRNKLDSLRTEQYDINRKIYRWRAKTSNT